MATKSDFTEREWDTLQKGVTGAGFLVAVADRGFFDSFKEARALANHLQEARKANDSELVKELAEVKGTGFGLTDSADEIEAETTEALRSAMSTLARKASDEVDAYRDFVLGVAQSVAAAAADVAAAETGAIEKIRTALQTAAP
jgi:hypothetical protein